MNPILGIVVIFNFLMLNLTRVEMKPACSSKKTHEWGILNYILFVNLIEIFVILLHKSLELGL